MILHKKIRYTLSTHVTKIPRYLYTAFITKATVLHQTPAFTLTRAIDTQPHDKSRLQTSRAKTPEALSLSF